MDYSEYTRIQIYLPFSGIHDLAPEDVQGSDLEVKYNIDVLTGDCVINVKCGQSVLYKFTGNMKLTIPITARDSTALSAGITIFFKALMKEKALSNSNKIILKLGILLEKTIFKENR